MKKFLFRLFSIGIIVSPFSHLCSQGNAVYTVKANQVKAPIQPTMWGIFFEDINLAADGGVYAELVKNRSFEFASPLMGWRELRRSGATGNLLILNRTSQPSNPRFLRATSNNEGGNYGLSN